MKFTPNPDSYSHDRLSRTGFISDGEVIPTYGPDHGNQERKFKITDARVVFNARDGVWHCGYVTVAGLVLKNDGTPGMVRAERALALGHPGTPEWAARIVRHLQPEVPAPSAGPEVLELD